MPSLRPPRILVVDDDPLTRRAITRLIGHDFPSSVIGHAGDARTALDMIAAERWDLVLLDISMPGTSGLEALREMRARNELVPVAVVSGLSAVDYEAAAVAAGAFGYVQKDRIPHELHAIVSHAVSDLHAGGRP